MSISRENIAAALLGILSTLALLMLLLSHEQPSAPIPPQIRVDTLHIRHVDTVEVVREKLRTIYRKELRVDTLYAPASMRLHTYHSDTLDIAVYADSVQRIDYALRLPERTIYQRDTMYVNTHTTTEREVRYRAYLQALALWPNGLGVGAGVHKGRWAFGGVVFPGTLTAGVSASVHF